MKSSRRSKRWIWVIVFVSAIFPLWFVTASADMAVQRIASGTGPIDVMVSEAFDWYASPIRYCLNIPVIGRMSDYLGDQWCSILDAPETTP